MLAPAPTPQRIVLAGFMGSGKTTVGRLLARDLGWHFADLDETVEARCGLSVPEIFARLGESAFREGECAALQELLARERVVISLGGGAPETPGVRDLLAETPLTVVVHLDAPLPLLLERCSNQAQVPGTTPRPLLASLPAAEVRYLKRLPLYTQIAHHRVDASAASPHNLVAVIRQSLDL